MSQKVHRIARIPYAARDRRATMKLAQMAAIALGTSVASGCDTVAAVATTPITMPIMIIGARVNDGGPSIEELRETSQWKAEEALVRALEHGDSRKHHHVDEPERAARAGLGALDPARARERG